MQSRSYAVAAALCILAACDDSTGPDNLGVQFGEPISLAQLESEIEGTARIEIEFTDANGLVAREIEVEPDDAEEKITSRVIAMNAAAGTLTLELGNLVVTYNSATRFRAPTNSNVGRASWESTIAAELNAGETPAVEVRRNQPSAPQAPTVATFTADDLRIADDFDDAKIEVYVDADNYTEDPSPPPLAILRVFNLPVQIVSATRIQRILNGAPQSGSVQFEGQITAVNASASTLTLADGTVIQLAASTTFDPEGDLLTLNATATAVTSGDFVRVEGNGTVASVGPPRTIDATRVKIEVDD
jgi:hypothetical protein